MGLLDGGIATIIANALDFLLLDGTLRRENVTGLDSYGNPVLGTPVTYTFRGFEDEYTAGYRARAGIPETDVKIVIAANSISTMPVADDRLTIRSGWYQARNVVTDPARAVYEVQCFKVDAP